MMGKAGQDGGEHTLVFSLDFTVLFVLGKNIESISLAGLARVGEMILAEAFREISFGRRGHLDNVLEHSSVGGNTRQGGQSGLGSDHS